MENISTFITENNKTKNKITVDVKIEPRKMNDRGEKGYLYIYAPVDLSDLEMENQKHKTRYGSAYPAKGLGFILKPDGYTEYNDPSRWLEFTRLYTICLAFTNDEFIKNLNIPGAFIDDITLVSSFNFQEDPVFKDTASMTKTKLKRYLALRLNDIINNIDDYKSILVKAYKNIYDPKHKLPNEDVVKLLKG